MANGKNVIEYIISQMDFTIQVDADGSTCDTKNATLGKILTDGNGVEYKVIEIAVDELIKFEPPFAGGYLSCPNPLFLHGKPRSTNAEYLQISNRSIEKTPFMWLIYPMTKNGVDRDSSIEASFSVTLFLLDNYSQNWINDQHNEYIVRPMENLWEMFKDAVYYDYGISDIENESISPIERFGVEVTSKGADKTIINDNFSGISVSFNLDVYDVKGCKC